MSEQHMFEIFQKMFSKQEIKDLTESLIIDVANGYELFGEYLVTKKDRKYQLTKYGTALDVTFYSLQNAIIYATSDKRNKVMETKRILELDILLEGANSGIITYKNYTEKVKDVESKIVGYNKLNEAKLRKKSIVNEIEKYMRETKSWQESRFKQAIK